MLWGPSGRDGVYGESLSPLAAPIELYFSFYSLLDILGHLNKQLAGGEEEAKEGAGKEDGEAGLCEVQVDDGPVLAA